MRYLAVIPVVYTAACLQTSLAEALEIGRAAPDVLALAAAAIGLAIGGNAGLVLVAAVGMVEDLLSPGRLGIATAWYLLAGWTAMELAERFGPRRLTVRVLACGLFAAVAACGIGLTRSTIGEPAAAAVVIVGRSAAAGIYTAALAAPLWLTMWYVERNSFRLER